MQTTFDSGGEWVAAMQGARAARRRWRRRQRIASEWRALNDIGRALWRRIHRRCPGEERDPFPEYGPADRGVAAVDWLLMAAGIAIAVAAWVAVALVLAFG